MEKQVAEIAVSKHFVDDEVILLNHELNLLTEAFQKTNDYRREELKDVKIVKHLERKIRDIRGNLKTARSNLSHSGYAHEAAKALHSAHHEIETLKLLEARFEELINKKVEDEKHLLSNLRRYREELETDKESILTLTGVGGHIHAMSVGDLTQATVNNMHSS